MLMKTTVLETLHAAGGDRAFDFVKISTDDGIVGWSEYNEAFGGLGLTQAIERLAPCFYCSPARPFCFGTGAAGARAAHRRVRCSRSGGRWIVKHGMDREP